MCTPLHDMPLQHVYAHEACVRDRELQKSLKMRNTINGSPVAEEVTASGGRESPESPPKVPRESPKNSAVKVAIIGANRATGKAGHSLRL